MDPRGHEPGKSREHTGSPGGTHPREDGESPPLKACSVRDMYLGSTRGLQGGESSPLKTMAYLIQYLCGPWLRCTPCKIVKEAAAANSLRPTILAILIQVEEE